MLLESTLLQKIVTRNVVKLTLESTTLENNFELILKALKSHDSVLQQYQDKVSNLQKELSSLTKSHAKNVQNVKEMDKRHENGIKNVSETVNGHDSRIKKIEAMLEQSRRINPQNVKQESQKDISNQYLSHLETKIFTIQQTLASYSTHADRIKELEEISKKNQKEIQHLTEELEKMQKVTNSLKNSQHSDKANERANDSQQLKKMRKDLDLLSQQIKNLVSQSQLQKELSQKAEQPIAKLKQGQDELVKKIKKLSDQIWKLNDQIYSSEKQARQKNFQKKHILDDILRQLADLKSSLDKDRTLSARNTDSVRKPESELQTQISPLKQKVEIEIKKQIEKDLEQSDLRKEIIQKLKQQKGDFNKAIKKLDILSHRKDEEEKQRLNRLEDKIQKLEFLMQGKVDEDNLKKWMKYVQNKIGYVYRIVNVEMNEQDAYIGRKNWFCLSCDKKLEGYKGKVGNHMIGNQLRGKTIDTDVVGGGMLFKNKSRIELPQFKK